jgi:UDP-N-acetylglucosamine transferase subunit ALG13
MYLVSVGTTKFDGLVEAADNLCELMDRADFVIAHAGIGVLFESLQLRKKVICVPNMERSDKHQIEIAEELNRRGLILLVKLTGDLKEAVDRLAEFSPKKFDIPQFQAEDFCKLADVHDNQVVAILSSGGRHLEEARILADLLISYNSSLSIDFYISFKTKVDLAKIHRSFTVHFRPYTAKYRGSYVIG